MKLKELTQEQLDDIAGIVEVEGFWYALTDGGYLRPEALLDDQEDIDKMKEAIKVIREFEAFIPE